jgi:hypothetical protein
MVWEISIFLFKANTGYNLEGKNPVTFRHLLKFYETVTNQGQ